MGSYEYRFIASRPLGTAILAVGGLWCLYRYTSSSLTPGYSKHRHIARAPAETSSSQPPEPVPYPPDALPGGRDVETAYGRIRVYEWGPETGDKVVLMHGISTPCVALGDMAKEFVRNGCRVMLFDFFGRGYSEAPTDLPYDDRLYTVQLLLALASSPLPWTGTSAFHLLGFSLGGALAASFAAYNPRLVRSLTLVCPGGLIRTSHVGLRSRLLYSRGLLPEKMMMWLARRRLQPRRGVSADVPGGEDGDVDFDEVRLTREGGATVGDVVRWQLEQNEGLVQAYMSSIWNAPIYGQHDGIWRLLGTELTKRRRTVEETGSPAVPGLEGGRICLIFGARDPIVVPSEWMEDCKVVLGEDGADIHVLKGGHEIAITRGSEIAQIATESWRAAAATVS